MKERSTFGKVIRGIITISVLLYGVYYINENLDTFQILLKVNWKILGFMIAFILINIYASASENSILYQALGAPIGKIESFGLTNVSAFFSLFFPQGGTITKAVYLKQRYKIPFSKVPAMYLGLFVIYLLIGASIILITNFVTISMGGTIPTFLWTVACSALTPSLLFMVDFPKELFSKLGKFGTLMSNYSDGWRSLRTDRPRLIMACIWQLTIFVSSGIWVSTAYYSLGIKIDPMLGISLSILISFTNILVIVPGNLGIQEAVYGYFTLLTGMPFADGVVVSALVRVVLLVVTLFLTPLSWYFLFYRQNIHLNRQKFTENP